MKDWKYRRVYNESSSSEDENDINGKEYDYRENLNANNYSNYNPIRSVLANTELSPKVQNHMVRVYGNLALTTASASIGTLLSMHRVLPMIGGAGTLASIGLLLGIPMARGVVGEPARLAMLLGFGFLQGWGVGPLVGSIYALDEEIILMAVLGSLIAFLSFTGAALFTARRSYLYLGGMLGFSSLLVLITSFFPAFYNFNLYLGLFTLCFYIIYDTQMIVERAEMCRSEAERDSIGGAVQLFMDLFGTFVRLILILRGQNQRKQSEEKSKKKRK